MGKEGNSTPQITEEYKEKAGLLSLNPGAFNYYSIFGEGGMWSFSFCDAGKYIRSYFYHINYHVNTDVK